MIILNEKIDKTDLQHAVNAELHADLEQLLLENGSPNQVCTESIFITIQEKSSSILSSILRETGRLGTHG